MQFKAASDVQTRNQQIASAAADRRRRSARRKGAHSIENLPTQFESLEGRLLMSTSPFSLVVNPATASPMAAMADGGGTAVVIRSAAAVAASGGTTSSTITGGDSSTSNLSTFAIVINAGAGLAANSAALAAFQRAAAQWAARISDPVTVTIDADLSNLGSTSIIGQTGSVTLIGGYDLIRNQAVADAGDEADDSIVGFLPTAAQVSFTLPAGFTTTGNIAGTKANLKAMGFTGLDAQFGASDASITFNSGFAFDFDNSNGITAGTMDFETVAAHEIGHALGFVSEVDSVDFSLSKGQTASVSPNVLDLFRFGDGTANDPGTTTQFQSFARDLRTGASGVAAITDQITTWGAAAAETFMATGSDTGDGRQASHWKDNLGLGIMDPTLAFGELVTVGDADFRAMDLIGWDIAEPGAGSNNAPVAVNDTGNASEDAILVVSAPGLLTNDTDSDGDALTVTSSSGTSANGAVVSVSATGGYSYNPTAAAAIQALAAGQTLLDTFSYTITDGHGGSASASVTITVTGANDAPVANNDSATIAKKTNTATGNVLSNDTDVDKNALTAALVSGPTKGTVVLNANGTFTYTPGSSFSGTDTFTYRASDGAALSNIATVTISKPGTGGGGGGGGGPRPRLTAALESQFVVQAKLVSAMAAYSALGSAAAVASFSHIAAWQESNEDGETGDRASGLLHQAEFPAS